jgi:DNA-directed RNA polymerase subunit E'/Rpb7
VQNYDILKDTWIYQEIRQQVIEEQEQSYISEQQHILLKIIHLRFPRATAQAKVTLETVSDPAILRSLLIKIGAARTEKEARQYLMELQKQEKP